MERATCGVPPPNQGVQVSSTSVVQAIERLTFNVLRCLVDVVQCACSLGQSGKVPSPAAVLLFEPCHSRVQEHGFFVSSTDRQRRLHFRSPHWRRLARLFVALDGVHRLNKAGRSCTQRELFYRAISECKELFGHQRIMDAALRDVAGALQIGRPHLGILAAEKGLVAGEITFKDPKSYISTAAQGATGTSIGESMLQDDGVTIQISKNAQVILVVEKDTVFQHLLHSGLLSKLPMILVTGRGYPDLLTRRFLQKLQRIAPHLKQLYLGDYDPDGMAIYLLYLSSCEQLKCLGLHQKDVENLPNAASLPLTQRDQKLKASLLRREEVHGNPSLAAELEAMDVKFELEALHSVRVESDELTEKSHMALHFIPEKIKCSSWL